MSHSAVLGDIEVPLTYSPSEAVGLMQESGIVGAGGAGFPTYVKYQSPPATLVVNGAESEPGYYADKLLLRDEPEAFIDVLTWMRRTFGMERIVIAAETVAKPYMTQLEALAPDHDLEVAYIEPIYKFGQERALCREVLGVPIPPKERPDQHGIIVNNVESVFNVYRAAFRKRPVRTKFLHLYGEVEPLTVYEAPIGTLAEDLLEIHGADRDAIADCLLYDGGPVLCERCADPLGSDPCMVPVRRTTNAFLVVDPDKDRPRKKHYPSPDYKDNSIDAPWAPREIVNVESEVDRVRVPLKGKFWAHGELVVTEGDLVEQDQVLAHPVPEKLSVGVHASIPGRVTLTTDDFVEITRE